MKKYLIVLAGALLFSSCDNRDDYFFDVNKKPTLSLAKNGVEVPGTSLTDSLKIGNPYSLQFSIQDEENIAFKAVSTQGTIQPVVSGNYVNFEGKNEEQAKFTLIAKDSFGASAEFSLTFTVFRNLPPVANFTATLTGGASAYEYEVDASASIDRDARFNGHIVLYEYTFQNYTFTSTLNKVRYIFGSSGQKVIRVRVKDDSGDWSELTSKYVLLS